MIHRTVGDTCRIESIKIAASLAGTPTRLCG